MQNEASNINQQIDRILSSNIKDQLLKSLPFQLFQSPVANKKQQKSCLISSQNDRLEERNQFEEDLYQKAQKIFKLKQLLQSQLSNINQIVQENQKLTEANLCLKIQIKNLKVQLQWLKNNVFQSKSHALKELQTQVYSTINKKNSQQIYLKKQTIFQDEPIKLLHQDHSQIDKNIRLQIVPNLIFETVYYVQNQKTVKQSEKSIQTQNDQNYHQKDNFLSTNQIRNQLINLGNQNHLLKQQLKKLKLLSNKQQEEINCFSTQKSPIRQSVQCYSSVFMKSVLGEQENIQQFVVKALFKSEKSLFDILSEAKYFGKIVLNSKNGNAIEQYKNGFQYEGNFRKNYRHGLGKLFYKDKIVYSGQWKNGKFDGKGSLFYYLNLNVEVISGNFKEGNLEGPATMRLTTGTKLRLQFKKNQIMSQGMIILDQNQRNRFNKAKSYLGCFQICNTMESTSAGRFIKFKTNGGQLFEL